MPATSHSGETRGQGTKVMRQEGVHEGNESPEHSLHRESVGSHSYSLRVENSAAVMAVSE